MRTCFSPAIRAAVLLAVAVTSQTGLHAVVLDRDAFERDWRDLVSAPHRLSGTDENRRSARFIRRRLAEIGLSRVYQQHFPLWQTDLKTCTLDVAGNQVKLLPVRPNVTILSATDEEGLSGPLIYLGKGGLEDFGTRSIRNAIAVLDYDCGDNWPAVFQHGAQAVIFLGTPEATDIHSKRVGIPANVPRFYCPPESHRRLNLRRDYERATIVSHVRWRLTHGTNILAFLPGSRPIFDMARAKPEVMVLAANYDTYGEVPRRSPGARAGANVAALLAAAEHFQQHPPRRDLVFAFFDDAAHLNHGARRFYHSIMMREDLSKELVVEHTHELGFVRNVRRLLDDGGNAWLGEQDDAYIPGQDRAASLDIILQNVPEDERNTLTDAALRLLRRKAEDRRNDVSMELMQLRRRRRELRQITPQPDNKLERVQEQIEHIEESKAGPWDDVRRNLGAPSLLAIEPAMYKKLVNDVGSDLASREKELALLTRMDEQRRELRDALADRWICLHAVYEFSDAAETWGVAVSDPLSQAFGVLETGSADTPGYYPRILAALQEAATASSLPVPPVSQTLQDTLYGIHSIPVPRAHSGSAAGAYGLYNLEMTTLHDARARDGHPADTVENLDWRPLFRQADSATALLGELADSDSLSLRRVFENRTEDRLPRWSRRKYRATGDFAKLQVTGSLRETRGATHSLVAIWACPNAFSTTPWLATRLKELPLDFTPFAIEVADSRGRWGFVGLPKSTFTKFGAFAAQFDDRGGVTAVTNKDTLWLDQKTPAPRQTQLFPAMGYMMATPLGSQTLQASPDVMRAGSNTRFRPQRAQYGQTDRFCFFYLHRNTNSDAVKIFHPQGIVALNTTRAKPLGTGYRFGDLTPPLAVNDVTSHDLWGLNERRLSILRTRGVPSVDLELLHSSARRSLQKADERASIALQTAALAQSAATSRKIYEPIRQTLDDLVHAVVVLLLLSIPFAFAMERLLICASSIYGRILGFGGIFAVTFMLLYLMHPGFAVATTPVMILLSFVIILLSSLVIHIVIRKFKVELQAMQGRGQRLHRVQLSRVGTMVAAVNMGVSTMRRRALRTSLTALTVVILTFTILCFASLEQGLGTNRTYVGPVPKGVPYDTLVHRLDYHLLPPDLSAKLRGLEGENVFLGAQYWLTREEDTDAPFAIADARNRASVAWTDALMGLTPSEVERWPALAAALQTEGSRSPAQALRDNGVYIPALVQQELNLSIGDELVVHGRVMTLAGTLDTRRLQRLQHLDGAPVLPVDFRDPSAAMVEEGTEEETSSEAARSALVQREFVRLNPNQIAILSADNVRGMGGKLHILTAYTPGDIVASEYGEAVARVTDLPTCVWGRSEDGVDRVVLTRLTQLRGASTVLIPIILGGLIIFGTLFGSITDREKEIYTFSALGLAPAHVGFLFFAEAGVYAVVGGLGGQLVAQAIAIGASRLADMGLMHAPSINFSSTNAMFAIAAVMATVLISAIYPAVVASRSANPGLARSWKLPPPEGDDLDMVFPFTVSAYDITGLISFLAEHFRAHNDVGLGGFAATHVQIGRDAASENLYLSADIALAPFDLGVTERFTLTAVPSEISGVDEVAIHLHRTGGAIPDWMRCNRTFLHDLRKQFLLWRTCSAGAIEEYRNTTLRTLGEAPSATAASATAPTEEEQS